MTLAMEPTHARKIGALAAAVIALAAVACTAGPDDEEKANTSAEATPAPIEESPTEPSGTGPFLVDLDTGEQTPLPEALAGGRNYVVSPDGAKVAYGTCCSAADKMKIANIDGTDARALKSPKGLNYYGARWSPEGTKLVYQEREGGGDTARTGDVGNLFVEDVSSGRKTQVTDLALRRAWWWFLAPTFSPDGEEVLFHLPRSKSETTEWDVWSVPVIGGEPQLVLRNAVFPMPSAAPILPNGVHMAFVSPQPDDFAGRSLTTARVLSPPGRSDLRQTLVKAEFAIDFPTMSPDSGKIAYHDGSSIYVFEFTQESGLGPGGTSEVAHGSTAEWLDGDTLIVSP